MLKNARELEQSEGYTSQSLSGCNREPLTPKPMQGDTSWFVHDHFGIFIHGGLYAMPARHE